jgi:hypothetical protein
VGIKSVDKSGHNLFILHVSFYSHSFSISLLDPGRRNTACCLCHLFIPCKAAFQKTTFHSFGHPLARPYIDSGANAMYRCFHIALKRQVVSQFEISKRTSCLLGDFVPLWRNSFSGSIHIDELPYFDCAQYRQRHEGTKENTKKNETDTLPKGSLCSLAHSFFLSYNRVFRIIFSLCRSFFLPHLQGKILSS